MKTVLKLLSALAAVFGAAFVIATYGDKIVAWCKKFLSACPVFKVEVKVEDGSETPEAPKEATPAEEPAPKAAPEDPIPSTDPVAEETDFEA